MSKNLFNTKEDIRTRMLRNAMDYWGTTNVNDMDPMVKLLVEALSAEIFNVSNDVKNLENRMLGKISRILASDYLTSALPAHAVIKANPIEDKEELNAGNHFLYKKLLAKEAGSKSADTDVFFSPAGSVEIFNAAIKYTSNGKAIFEHDEVSNRKSKVLSANNLLPAESNGLWVGLECQAGLSNLQNLALFFDWSDFSANDDFYNLLALVKCSLGDVEMQTIPGLIYKEDLNIENRPVFYEQNVINLITRDIKEYYTTRFISLTDSRLKDISNFKQAFPAAFQNIFDTGELSKLKPCVWIKIDFPATIAASVIDDLQIAINCLPVINRRRHDQKYRLKEINNIIPIKVEENEHFLSIHELFDDKNVYYSEIPYTQATQNYEGSYSVRNGGAERFDSRSANQLIEYLFELLRDEKAAFASYGNDFLNSTLKALEQNLALIDKKSRGALNSSELFNYLIIKPGNKSSMIYLQYWTTFAEAANNIRRGTRLQQFETHKLKADSLRLMTTTIGGRKRLGETERVQAYKYGLTTKDRIVTKADLIGFCYYELGNKITDVKTTNGLIVSTNPKEGLRKTIDIYLTPSADNKLSVEEWNTLLTLLQSKLSSRSVLNAAYRLFVQA